MGHFLAGICAVAFAASAVFFLRFWRQTSDRFFAIFALAFAALAVNYVGLGMLDPNDESRRYYFLIRLLAFLCFIAGIVDKSRRT